MKPALHTGRPESSSDAHLRALAQKIYDSMQLKTEAFCPTGEGGGQDNSCSPTGDSSSGTEEINNVRVYRNPTAQIAKAWLQRFGPLRGMTNTRTGETYIWPANKAWHVEVAKGLGFEDGDLEARTGQAFDRDTENRWHIQTADKIDKLFGKRKRVPIAAQANYDQGEFELCLSEAFCPGDEGGGVDNSCPPANKGDGVSDAPSDTSRGSDTPSRGGDTPSDTRGDTPSDTPSDTPAKPKFYQEGEPVEAKGKTRELGKRPDQMEPPVRKAFEEAEAPYPPVDPEANDTFLRQVVSIDKNGQPKFTPQREALHQQMVDEVRQHVPPAEGQPIFVLMGGGPASGKSSIVNQGRAELPENTVKLNVDDDFKNKLPEYVAMSNAGDPMAAAVAHEESSYLAKRAMSESFAAKQNVVLDGTGDGSEKSVLKKVAEARAAGYKIRAEYVTKPIGDAVAWADKRAQESRRAVPRTVLENTHRTIARILPKLIQQGAFDEFKLWDTTESEADPDRPGRTRARLRLVAQASGRELKVLDATLWKKFQSRAEAGVMEAQQMEQPEDIPRSKQRAIIQSVYDGVDNSPYDTPDEAAFRKAIVADIKDMLDRGIQRIDFENDLD